MYAEFFGLRELPFNITPDPRFLYLNECYQEALAALSYGIEARKGFISLIGEAGTGKTTLLRRLIDTLDAGTKTVLLLNPTVSFDEILEHILAELDVPTSGGGKLLQIRRLNEFLLEHTSAGGNVVLLIDEAQDLTATTLEELRLLSNLETAREKILQIILAGQPELEGILRNPSLRQLRQRVTLHVRVRPLTPPEVRSYVRTRLEHAGAADLNILTPEALARVAVLSRGIPRLVNVLCDASLLMGFVNGARPVTPAIVDAAWKDYSLEPEPSAAAGDPLLRMPITVTGATAPGLPIAKASHVAAPAPVAPLIAATRPAVTAAPPRPEPAPAAPAPSPAPVETAPAPQPEPVAEVDATAVPVAAEDPAPPAATDASSDATATAADDATETPPAAAQAAPPSPSRPAARELPFKPPRGTTAATRRPDGARPAFSLTAAAALVAALAIGAYGVAMRDADVEPLEPVAASEPVDEAPAPTAAAEPAERAAPAEAGTAVAATPPAVAAPAPAAPVAAPAVVREVEIVRPDGTPITAAEATEVIDRFRAAYEGRDVERLMGLFSPDAVENGRRGLEAIALSYRIALSNLSDVRYTLPSLAVSAGPHAAVRAPFVISYRQPSGATGQVRGDAEWALERRNGQIRIVSLSYRLGGQS